ncbi:MAG: SET domain-containing protein [Saprospiraceae bacterium]|nr:SET domain-containing protein [Saprospiraceae bacterium]
MFHPDARIQWINDVVGYGLVATRFIPKGTITYLKDPMELSFTPEHFKTLPPVLQAEVEKFSYIDEKGDRIVSWDFAKYVNHCCNCNTMSTGYGFEITLRDIHPGEEITDEYGIFNMEEPMMVVCDKPHCRKMIQGKDLEDHAAKWDEQLKDSLRCIKSVDQPLWFLLQEDIIAELNEFLENESAYKSVLALKNWGYFQESIEP